MPRSMHAFAALLALGFPCAALACAQTSPSPVTTAPVTSAPAVAPAPSATASAAAPPAVPTVAASAPSGPAGGAPGGEASARATPENDPGADARFRACHTDADCVAVLRGGCCQTGWKEAIATSQVDAYRLANACTQTPRPMCPMIRFRDTRVAR